MDREPVDISVVSPVYGCAACLAELCARTIAAVDALGLTLEIILVDDASPDGAWTVINSLCASDRRIKGIRLSRNYGQHHAVTAGIDHASGRWLVVMDCDLQDRPEEIPALFRKISEGYDLVFAQRANRKDSFLKKASSRAFYRLFGALSGHDHNPAIGNFGIYSAPVVRVVRSFRDRTRYFPYFAKWAGFRQASIDLEHGDRPRGKSSYTFLKQLSHATNIIVAFSPRPLYVSIGLGLALALVSCGYSIWLVVRYFTYGITVEGWTSVMVGISFFSGLVLLNLGILGVYVARIFEEVKQRPHYTVMEAANVDAVPGQAARGPGA